MNRDLRRQQREMAQGRLRGSKAYVVVSWDGKRLPVFHYDVSGCKNERDLRHQVMQRVAEGVEGIVLQARATLMQEAKDREMSERVAEIKAKRSEELGASNGSDKGSAGGVDRGAGVLVGADVQGGGVGAAAVDGQLSIAG